MTLLEELLAMVDKSKDFPDEKSRNKAKKAVMKAFKEEEEFDSGEEE